MLTETTEITLVTEATVNAKHWAPSSQNGASQNGTQRNGPMLLLSDEADAGQWSAFAEMASESGHVYATWNVSTYKLIQTIWAIGEPVSVIVQGKETGDKALAAAKLTRGGVRALILVDYGLDEDQEPPFNSTTCPLVLVRGRQSEIASHRQIVAARAALGSKCKLVELENCGSRAAESCPQDFAFTIDWFLGSGS